MPYPQWMMHVDVDVDAVVLNPAQQAVYEANGWVATDPPDYADEEFFRALWTPDVGTLVAPLDEDQKVPVENLPAGVGGDYTDADAIALWSEEPAVSEAGGKLLIEFPTAGLDAEAIETLVASIIQITDGLTRVYADNGEDGDGTVTLGADLEWMQDRVAEMLTTASHTGITVTYGDTPGTVTLEVTSSGTITDRSIVGDKLVLGTVGATEVDTDEIAVYTVDGELLTDDGDGDAGTAATHAWTDDLAASTLALIFNLYQARSLLVANDAGIPIALTADAGEDGVVGIVDDEFVWLPLDAVGSGGDIEADDAPGNPAAGYGRPVYTTYRAFYVLDPTGALASLTGQTGGAPACTLFGEATTADTELIRINGTFASPTKMLAGQEIGHLGAGGQYDTTPGHRLTNKALLRFLASQDWTASSSPTTAEVHTTPTGSTTPVVRLKAESNGDLLTGSGGLIGSPAVAPVIHVNHGATAGTARPTGAASVRWYGSVLPTNWAAGDSWTSSVTGAVRTQSHPKATGLFTIALLPQAIPSGVWTPIGLDTNETDQDGSHVIDTSSTTIAAGSNAVALPTGTINVASAAAFPSTGALLINGPPGSGITTFVRYTGKTSTTFTGCTLGTGTMATGHVVKAANELFKVQTRGFINTVGQVAWSQNASGARGCRVTQKVWVSGTTFLNLVINTDGPHASSNMASPNFQTSNVYAQPFFGDDQVTNGGAALLEVYQDSGSVLTSRPVGIESPCLGMIYGQDN